MSDEGSALAKIDPIIMKAVNRFAELGSVQDFRDESNETR